MDPTRFAFGLMTRSKAITYDNLALRAPEFVKLTDKVVARDTQAQGFEVDTAEPAPPMFQPFRLRGMTLANRVVVSPMDQYSAVDGMPTDWHMVHSARAPSAAPGLMFTEMTCVSDGARITPGCTGMYNDAQEAAWKRIVDFVHANSGSEVLPAARSCRAKGRDQADVGGHGPAAAAGRAGRSWRRRRCPIIRTARCRAR